MKNIGKTFRIIRQVAGIRQGDFAKRLGFSQNYLSLLENGKREPSLKFLNKASKLLNIPISAFFFTDLDSDSLSDPTTHRAAENLNQMVWELIRSRINLDPQKAISSETTSVE